jgi:hypothetical protein
MEDDLGDAELLGESTLAKLAPTPKVDEVAEEVETAKVEEDDEQKK